MFRFVPWFVVVLAMPLVPEINAVLIEDRVGACKSNAVNGTVQKFCEHGQETLNLLQTKASIRRVNDGPVDVPGRSWESRDTDLSFDLLRRSSLDPDIDMAKRGYFSASRPIFRKQLRCRAQGPSLADCEECTGPEDCFGDCEIVKVSPDTGHLPVKTNNLCVHSAPKSPWKRHVILVHIECPVSDVGIWLSAKEVSHGTMTMYWDGDKMSDILAKQEKRFWDFKALAPGGHTLSLQWTPPQTAGADISASAALESFSVILDRRYSICMDTKSCLEELNKLGPAGSKLRSSNALLSSCLSKKMKKAGAMPDVGPACLAWRKCLKRGGNQHAEHMKLLLSAAAITEQVDIHNDKSTKSCIHPPTEDPMAWDCDCFKEMHQRCDAVGAKSRSKLNLCLRAQFCMNQNVCMPWYDKVCKTKRMKRWRTKMEKTKSQLVQGQMSIVDRAAYRSGSRVADMDGIAGAKRCK
eukprot:gnl/TRDRNA2_/TRDRNA2_41975_c0_seq1.p1 gnl/TRDRNA2_/TRDRNA2_41975_c0~~gnl/TRDRNA2_/TRDRNA2_41975_c0_seq1.p1  ORF type:complete len:466 (+),score=56.48 gnl/TRDRNA2_/TRDRNA2_41975_c0_seq1:85-1482(+)